VFDPDTSEWSDAQPVPIESVSDAILLGDGRVLAIGVDEASATTRIAVWDPATDRWDRLRDLPEARGQPAIVQVDAKRILVAGGFLLIPDGGPEYVAEAWLYDLDGDRWSPTAALPTDHGASMAALLRDGTAMVVGPYSTDRFDPASEAWLPISRMQGSALGTALASLPDGRLAVAGMPYCSIDPIVSQVYDPARDTWTSLGEGITVDGLTLTALDDGRLLAAGGSRPCDGPDGPSGPVADAFLFDPAQFAGR
jgi:hypothetical protein